ncbi:MAG: hypothetical protein ACK5OT_04670 [Burkholderiales bacterium]
MTDLFQQSSLSIQYSQFNKAGTGLFLGSVFQYQPAQVNRALITQGVKQTGAGYGPPLMRLSAFTSTRALT